MKRSVSAFASILVVGCSLERPAIRVFPAPDCARANLQAPKESSPVWAEVLDWANESAICIRDGSSEDIRCKESFFSSNSDQGSVIEHLAWSPGGRYLAYQMHSSGGHQPYYCPVTVLDVETCESREMQALDESQSEWSVVSSDVTEGTKIFWDSAGRLHYFAVLQDLEKWRELVYDPGMKNQIVEP